jgi:hypothetical protein
MVQAREAVAAWGRATVMPDDMPEGPGRFYLTREDGYVVALDVATVRGHHALGRRPRLRFDKVALRVTRHLQAALQDAVPADRTLLFTLTAPILVPAQTTAAIEALALACLAPGGTPEARVADLHGNRVQVRVASSGACEGRKVIGMVHNPDTDANALLDLTQAWLEASCDAVQRPAPARTVDARWLALLVEPGMPTEAYRLIDEQLGLGYDFARVLIVRQQGKVEALESRSPA